MPSGEGMPAKKQPRPRARATAIDGDRMPLARGHAERSRLGRTVPGTATSRRPESEVATPDATSSMTRSLWKPSRCAYPTWWVPGCSAVLTRTRERFDADDDVDKLLVLPSS